MPLKWTKPCLSFMNATDSAMFGLLPVGATTLAQPVANAGSPGAPTSCHASGGARLVAGWGVVALSSLAAFVALSALVAFAAVSAAVAAGTFVSDDSRMSAPVRESSF